MDLPRPSIRYAASDAACLLTLDFALAAAGVVRPEAQLLAGRPAAGGRPAVGGRSAADSRLTAEAEVADGTTALAPTSAAEIAALGGGRLAVAKVATTAAEAANLAAAAEEEAEEARRCAEGLSLTRAAAAAACRVIGAEAAVVCNLRLRCDHRRVEASAVLGSEGGEGGLREECEINSLCFTAAGEGGCFRLLPIPSHPFSSLLRFSAACPLPGLGASRHPLARSAPWPPAQTSPPRRRARVSHLP